ncbi:M48 family metallopeptidase [uncultured Pseudomonas sp.]|uniref:M48 family metallopeptidase n=1 Tax=uncultured Pseudomonas sp. TaxID=114707 RepID=UPI0025D3AF68|nr:M48 family metallopeptidase [uncultured Pseudomonas sp.]
MARYDLHLSGGCRLDVPTDTLRVSLLYHLKLTPEQAERLLPPATGILKRDLSAAEAHDWVERLTDAGLQVHLQEREGAPPLAQDLDLQARLAALRASGLPRPAFPFGRRLQLLAAVGTALLLSLLYLLPGLLGLLLALAALHAFAGLLHQDVLIACTLALPTALLGTWLAVDFLLPPLRRRPEAVATLPLTEAREPGLWQMVDSLCRAMGVRPPRRILLRAEADIRLAGAGRTLYLGLPLLPALTTRQYLASLAHALGHQVHWLDAFGGGLLNASLAWLERLGQELHPVRWMRRRPRLAQGWARLLFATARRLTQAASQRREARADHYEAQLGGSDDFRQTALRRRGASQAWREARRRSLAAQQEQGLAENLLELVEALLTRQSERSSLTPPQASRYWQRHPADQQRVNWVNALEQQPLLEDQRPAQALLDHYESHGRALTEAVYRQAGCAAPGERGATVADLVPELERDAGEEFALWSGHPWSDSPWLPLHLPLDRPTRALTAEAVRERLQRLAEQTSRAWQEAEKEAQRRCLLAFYEELHIHGLAQAVRGEGEFNQQHLQDYRAIDTWQTPSRQQLQQLAPLYRQRLELALARHRPGQAQARECFRLLVTLAEHYPEVERLREARLLVKEYRTLQRQLQGSPRINELCDFAKQDHQRRVTFWLQSPLRLPSSIADLSLGEHLQRHCPQLDLAQDSPSALYRHSAGLLPALSELHQRAWLHLARWCLLAEADNAPSLRRSA